MYIRAKPRVLKSGEKTHTYSIIESYRVHGDPRQRTLLNLGKDFNLPKEQWPTLMQLVLDGLHGHARLPFEDEVLRQASQDIMERLKRKGYDVHDSRDDRDAILTNEIHHTDTRTIGGERVALKALDLLEFTQILQTLNFNRDQIHWAIALVVGRMLSPGSERQTYDWMCERSGILELLRAKRPCDRTLYRIAAGLYAHRKTIMDELFGNTRALLGFTETIVFYDLTNTYYTGRKKGTFLHHGRSKDKRNDCPLVTLAMTLDASGFPRTAEILPGNASEPKTLRTAIEQLNGDQPTIIMDAGIATEANLAYLKEEGLNWICVQRTKTPPVPDREPDQVFQTTHEMDVRAWKLGENDGERRVYLHSEARQALSDQIITTKRVQFEAAIAHLNEGLTLPRRPKTYAVIERKVGRLMEKYKQVGYHYEVKVMKKKGQPAHAEKILLTRRSAYDACTEAFGGYVLRTSHTKWSCEDLARTYWQLGEIEHSFRTMKSDLGFRPIYHSKDEQIEAHLFLSILAFHVVHLVRSKLGAKQIHKSWATLKVKLNEHLRVTSVLPQNKTHAILLKQDQDLKPFQRQIFQAMGLKLGRNTQRIKAKRPEKENTEA